MLPGPRHALSAACLLAPLALAACRTTEELQISSSSGLRDAKPLDITLAQSLWRWKETPNSPGQRVRFRLGQMLLQLFPAHDGRAFLSPIGADLETEWNGDAHAWEARYSFDLSLQLDGVRHEVNAVGHGRSEEDAREAEREAMEDCVGDIYVRTATLLVRKDRP